jgi:hypothetical protein
VDAVVTEYDVSTCDTLAARPAEKRADATADTLGFSRRFAGAVGEPEAPVCYMLSGLLRARCHTCALGACMPCKLTWGTETQPALVPGGCTLKRHQPALQESEAENHAAVLAALVEQKQHRKQVHCMVQLRMWLLLMAHTDRMLQEGVDADMQMLLEGWHSALSQGQNIARTSPMLTFLLFSSLLVLGCTKARLDGHYS